MVWMPLTCKRGRSDHDLTHVYTRKRLRGPGHVRSGVTLFQLDELYIEKSMSFNLNISSISLVKDLYISSRRSISWKLDGLGDHTGKQ